MAASPATLIGCQYGATTTAVPSRMLRGMRGPPGQQLEGRRRDRHLDRMMLGRPGDLEAARVGHLHHFQRMPRLPACRGPGACAPC